jgi:hypothetical protein
MPPLGFFPIEKRRQYDETVFDNCWSHTKDKVVDNYVDNNKKYGYYQVQSEQSSF